MKCELDDEIAIIDFPEEGSVSNDGWSPLGNVKSEEMQEMHQDGTSKIVDFPGRCKSSVWNYYGFRQTADGYVDKSFAICRICHFLTKYIGNTTNLAYHLGRKHGINTATVQARFSYPGGADYNSSPSTSSTHGAAFYEPLAATSYESFEEDSTPKEAYRVSARSRYSREDFIEDETNCSVSTSSVKKPRFYAAGYETWQEPPQSDAEYSSPSVVMRNLEKLCPPKLTPAPNASSVREISLATAISDFLVTDALPLSTIEGVGFRRLLNGFIEPQYEKMAYNVQNRVKNVIVTDMYETVRQRVVQELAFASMYASLTFETWKSSFDDSYVTISAVFLDKTWAKKKYVLETRRNSNRMTSSLFCERAKSEICRTWSITEPLMIISEQLPDYVECFGKAIQNVLDECFRIPVLSVLVDRICAFVRQFRNLKDATNNGLPPDQQEAVSQVAAFSPFHWTSMYDMFVAVSSKYDALQAILLETETSESTNEDCKVILLSVEELDDLQNLLDVLGPLKTSSLALIEQESPTASIILPVVKQIISAVEERCVNTTGMTIAVKKSLLNGLSSLYTGDSRVNETLILCTTLDPRFKDLPFLHESGEASHQILAVAAKFIKRGAATTGVTSTKRDCDDLHESKRKRARDGWLNGPDDASVSSGSSTLTDTSAKASAMSMLFQRVVPEQDKKPSDANNVLSELNRYLHNEESVPLNSDINGWWKIRTSIYPRLSDLARLYLSLPATASSPAAIFTDAGRKAAAKRSHLESDVMDRMIFLHQNREFSD